MTSSTQRPEIIVFHYRFSPFAKRITWYLTLRGIPYSECLQPPTMPRPDIHALGTQYRRIPIVLIGRDIYHDTRLILQKLEDLYPERPKISGGAAQSGIEKLLEMWTVDGLFARAAQLLPLDLPLLRDPKFTSDREDYTGRSWERESLEKGRPEALVAFKGAFEMVERGFLGDGREWILGGEGPSLADIEAIWPFHWLTTLPGALPPDYISAQQFPHTYAWISRFDQATRLAGKKIPKPVLLSGAEVLEKVSAADFVEGDECVDVQDPTGLQRGQEVEVWPIDTGMRRRDRGVLRGLSTREIVIESKTKGGVRVKIHTPRHGFRIRGVGGKSSRL
ncbi:putative glutathione s-transferase protein [Botrytis cinerea BcDW1]|uniref:Similar to glutathione s-transferase-related protein n=2 Tax=Botryotinia fuckeliana TaxID=40559 RepID=G2YC09_BOTF4|nr:putative glutathione s-transferase protein [Botrytis cinerea BcDW1]CCD34750.1 similar to glutathione s-transferase-related protein [Botrytis cinerea T4]